MHDYMGLKDYDNYGYLKILVIDVNLYLRFIIICKHNGPSIINTWYNSRYYS